MSWQLLISFLSLYIFAHCHANYGRNYQGESVLFGFAVNISCAIGGFSWLFLIFYNAYFGIIWHSLVIGVICVAVGPFLAALLAGPYRGFRSIIVTLIGFLLWPLSAWWTYSIISGL